MFSAFDSNVVVALIVVVALATVAVDFRRLVELMMGDCSGGDGSKHTYIYIYIYTHVYVYTYIGICM